MPYSNKRFKRFRFRQAIKTHGTLARLDRVEFCECGSFNDQDKPEYDCPECHGIGWKVYDSPKTSVLMLNKNSQIMLERYGQIEQGGAGFTIPDNFRDRDTGTLYKRYVPAAFDIITLLMEKMREKEILTKGETHPHSGRTLEKATFLDVVDDECRISQIGGSTYTEGTDFRIVDDSMGHHRQIEWIAGGSSPATGSRYSFTYTTRPTYQILPDYPKHRRQFHEMLMTLVVAKQVSLGGFLTNV